MVSYTNLVFLSLLCIAIARKAVHHDKPVDQPAVLSVNSSARNNVRSPIYWTPLYGNNSHAGYAQYLNLRPFDSDFPATVPRTWFEPQRKCTADSCWIPVNVAKPPLLPNLGSLVYTGVEKIHFSHVPAVTDSFQVVFSFNDSASLCQPGQVLNGTFSTEDTCLTTRHLPFKWTCHSSVRGIDPHYCGWHSWVDYIPMSVMNCADSCYSTSGSSIRHCTVVNGQANEHMFGNLETTTDAIGFNIMLLPNLWSHCHAVPTQVYTYASNSLQNRALPCITGYYCPSPFTFLCDEFGCEQVLESSPCVYDTTKALCSHPYRWVQIPVLPCPLEKCFRMDSVCIGVGLYKCATSFGATHSVVPCDQCPDTTVSDVLFKAHGDHFGFQLHGDVITHRDFVSPVCSARLNTLAVHVRCNIIALVRLCCAGSCVYGNEDSNYYFPLSTNTLLADGLTVLHLGSFCTLQYGGRNDGFYLTDSPSTMYAFANFTSLPYYVLIPFIGVIILVAYLVFITCGLWYVITMLLSYVLYAFTFFLQEPIPPCTNNYCDMQYNKQLCGASIKNASQWKVHFIVFHGTWRHMINPLHIYYRWSFRRRTPLPANFVGYYKTPLGVFRNGSAMGWFLTGLLLSQASYVEAYTIYYNGQAQSVTYDGANIQLKAYSDIWTCVERGYTTTTTSTECSGHLACKASTAVACSKLWPKGKLCNANWTGSKCCSFCWYHGCSLCDVNSYCGECYLKPGPTKAVAYQCTHSSVEFTLTVTCQGYSNDFAVSKSGTIDTPCGKFTINSGIHSPLTTVTFSYYQNGYFEVPNHCPFFRGNCADYRLECTSSVQQHGIIRMSCVAPNCVPYTKHQVSNCQPSLDVVSRQLTLKSCAQGTTEIIFEPVVIEPINVPPTGLSVSECTYVSSSGSCYCRYTVECDAVASYVDDVLYSCGSETEGIVSCTKEQACIKVGTFEQCIEPEGIRLNDGVGLEESTIHSKSVTKTNWFAILMVILAILVLVGAFVLYWKCCRNTSGRVDFNFKTQSAPPPVYHPRAYAYAADDVTDAFYRKRTM